MKINTYLIERDGQITYLSNNKNRTLRKARKMNTSKRSMRVIKVRPATAIGGIILEPSRTLAVSMLGVKRFVLDKTVKNW